MRPLAEFENGLPSLYDVEGDALNSEYSTREIERNCQHDRVIHDLSGDYM